MRFQMPMARAQAQAPENAFDMAEVAVFAALCEIHI